MCEIISLPTPMDDEEREVLRYQLIDQVSSLSDVDLVEVLKWLEAIAAEEADKARQRGPTRIVPFRLPRGGSHAPSPA